MRKVLITVIATAALLGATVSADAQYHQRRHGGGGGGYHHHRGGGGGWVAPLVGGLLLGGAIYGLSQPGYAAPPQTYYPYSPTRTVCGLEHVYDTYGRYVGDRKTCYEVPN